MSFPMASARPSGEETLIARYFKPLASDPGAFDLVDDAAILKTVGEDVVVTTDVVVTGTIGDAALGLDILKVGPLATALADDAAGQEMLIARYRVPQPRNALAKAVCDHASAAMDVSDGLAGDLAKLCAASGVSAAIDLSSVPMSATGRKLLASGSVGIETIVSGGDDYEILCAIPENSFEA